MSGYTNLDIAGDVFSVFPISQQAVGALGVPLNCMKIVFHTSNLAQKNFQFWLRSIHTNGEKKAQIQLAKKASITKIHKAIEHATERLGINCLRVLPVVGTVSSTLRLAFHFFVFAGKFSTVFAYRNGFN